MSPTDRKPNQASGGITDPSTLEGSGGPAPEQRSQRAAAEPPQRVESQVARPLQEGPRATFAAVKPPALNLPQGGGAMRSIGETFKANPVTGTASSSIPIPLTPAPHGPTPPLSISYDSGSGNGLFGHGWSLGVGQLSRRTDKHLPEYRDSEDSDELLFGGEVLVPWLETVGSELKRYERPFGVDGKLERFRPRTEGGFARIDRITEPSGVRFIVQGSDNTLSYFGTTVASRIVDPNDDKRVYAWLLDKVTDDRGHVVEYFYKAENLANVPQGLPSEHARHAGLMPIVNRHLKSVRYGNTTMNDGSTYKFEVVFDYGEHDPVAPRPGPAGEVQTWPAREDRFSSHRAGFDMRTNRLCRRVLVFHHLTETGTVAATPILVRSLDLTYAPSPKLTQLLSAKVVGYRPNGATYTRQELPSVTFGYSEPAFTRAIGTLDREQVNDFNPQLLNQSAQWVDLDGEGLPGVLSDRRGAIHYKPNEGGTLARGRLLPSAPNLSPSSGAQLMDVDGSGRMAMVRTGGPGAGYHKRTDDGWGPFRPFPSNPTVDWSSPHLRLIDLNGDGFDDILITRGDHFVWYPSLGKDGYDAPQRVPMPTDEREGPRVVFAGRHSAVMLADMSGDGLTDIVRVMHSRVSYWPNQGYGRFGAEVVMDRSPQIDLPGSFHPARVRLADLDGTGAADLLYFDHDGVRIWLNEAGNGYSPPLTNPSLIGNRVLPTLTITDLHGAGVSTLVWSPRQPGEPVVSHTTPFGLDKPYLLESIDNGMGLEIRLQYGTSTRHYLADKKAGRRWATKLPFPVQVLDQVESYDAVSRTRLVTKYRYHHGHYDTVEREFCGFGMVETEDAETFQPGQGSRVGPGLFPNIPPAENGELPQAPVLTKTWFHTGAWFEKQSLEAAFANERWKGDTPPPAPLHCNIPSGLTPEEIREAHRALKGTTLRQEVYGKDNNPTLSPNPYTVSESAYDVKRLQGLQTARKDGRPKLHGVFQVLPRESREHVYDRIPADPRVSQWVAIDHDDVYGFITAQASVAYKRRDAARLAALADDALAGLTGPLDEQNRVYAVVTESDISHVDGPTGGYRLAIPRESRTYELSGLSGSSPLDATALRAHYATASTPANTLDYDGDQDPELPQRRLLERVKIRYYNGASIPAPPTDPTPLPFGTVDQWAVPYETYQLDLTTSILDPVFGVSVITPTTLLDAGYVTLDGETGYWIPSGRSRPAPLHFYLPIEVRDPFGNVTTPSYDAHHFFVHSIAAPLGNTVSAVIDYRVGAPKKVTDINGNQTEAAFDELGRVVKVAVMGKASEGLGDTLTDPTQEFTYVTDQWSSPQRLPNYVHAKARKEHGVAGWQESYTYSDGSGRVALAKVQAEPGKAPALDAGGNLIEVDADPRWVGTGRTVLNNKGAPVKQYEPYFSTTHEWEGEEKLVKWGVTPVIHYDAVGRAIRVDLPDGTYSKTEYGVWKTTSYDPNDTIADSLWAVPRQNAAHAEHDVYTAALAHANTPTRVYADSLGRAYLAVAQNNVAAPNTYIQTRTQLDIEGQPLLVKDPLGRGCQTHRFSIGGQLLQETNIDKGERLTLSDVGGGLLVKKDARGNTFTAEYDELRRPTHLWVNKDTAGEQLLERRVYGEAETNPQTNNLRGRLILLYDGAGEAKSIEFDFKGNLKTSSRKLATTYTTTPSWNALALLTTPSAVQSAAASLLESETFTETRAYDALNRITSVTAPDNSEFEPTYNEASLLERVRVRIRGASTWTTFVHDVDYDAKGQRTAIEYSPDSELPGATARIKREYTYDPLTYRLKRLQTRRASPANILQDLNYTFDPVGNIVRIKDDAQQSVFFNNSFVAPANEYTYDAIYRLIQGTGREHMSIGTVQLDNNDCPIEALPHANQSNAVRNYTQTYSYDRIGNILSMFHQAVGSASNTWTRTYTYTGGTNRLASNTVGAGPAATYTYDNHGSMTSMPHLSLIGWTVFDQMQKADKGGGGIVYFTYGADGQRVRKVWEQTATSIKERIYLGGYEIYRERTGTTVDLERQTLHVMDGVKRIAMVETKTVDTSVPPFTPTPRLRYQLGNHLGSAMLECDETGAVISYEEYHPYGTSSYRSSAGGVEVSARRYRYTGKERDDETGLYYHGARYYAPWLAKWTSADPLGIAADGPGVYSYVRDSPIKLSDPSGTDGTEEQSRPWHPAELAEEPNQSVPTKEPDAINFHIPTLEEKAEVDAEYARQMAEIKAAIPAIKVNSYLAKGEEWLQKQRATNQPVTEPIRQATKGARDELWATAKDPSRNNLERGIGALLAGFMLGVDTTVALTGFGAAGEAAVVADAWASDRGTGAKVLITANSGREIGEVVSKYGKALRVAEKGLQLGMNIAPATATATESGDLVAASPGGRAQVFLYQRDDRRAPWHGSIQTIGPDDSIHTHYYGRQGTILYTETADPAIIYEFELPNIAAAQQAQRDLLAGGGSTAWSVQGPNCLSHCNDILTAGGVQGAPSEDAWAIMDFLRNSGKRTYP